MLNALALAEKVLMIEGTKQEVVLAGETESVELVLVVLKLHRALSVGIGQGVREVAADTAIVFCNVVGLFG